MSYLQGAGNKVITAVGPNWKLYAAIAAAVLLVIITLTGSWYLWKPKAKVPEVAAPAQKQRDGSVVLEKAPDRKALPAMVLPPKTTLERTASVTVQPVKGPDAAGKCPPIKVDLALVRNKDTTRRIVASSPDGEVIAGIDVPVEDAIPPPKDKLWAAGAAYSTNQKYGGWVDRDIGPFRLGAQVNQASDTKGGVEGWARVGIRF